MDIKNKELAFQISRFWDWSGLDLTRYYSSNIDESLYPYMRELVSACESAISNLNEKILNKQLTNNILIALSIDNENEDVLDLISDCDDELIEIIIQEGTTFNLYNTRWQIAELIGRTRKNKYIPNLKILLHDSVDYVQQRALLSMSQIEPSEAVKESLTHLNNNPQIRLVSVRIIKEYSPQLMDSVREFLMEETNEYILKELR